MSLTERINAAQQGAPQRGEVAGTWRQPLNRPASGDGLADFKAKVHDSLFERLGTRLFEATNEEQLHSLVVSEIAELTNAAETALSTGRAPASGPRHRPGRDGPRPDRAVPQRPDRERDHGQRVRPHLRRARRRDPAHATSASSPRTTCAA